MKRKDASAYKLLLFILGVFIIILGSIVIRKPFGMTGWKSIFFWTSILLMYIGFFIPLTITIRERENNDHILLGGLVYYRGVVVYSIISIIIIALMKGTPIKLSLVLLMQFVAVFLFLIYVYLACFTAQHVNVLETIEEGKLAQIELLRESFKYLAIKAESLGDDRQKVKNLVNQINENFRYISPSENPMAIDLETRMLELLDSVSADNIFSGSVNCTDEHVISVLNQINDLYKQRKSIY